MNFSNIAHSDHGLTAAHVSILQSSPEIAAYEPGQFVLVSLPLPDDVESLECALYGPDAGDPPVDDSEVFLEVRGDRAGPSRLVDRPHRSAGHMVVIGIRGGVCFTAYGSRASKPSPMEPWDAERKHATGQLSAAEVDAARDFWAVHALAR